MSALWQAIVMDQFGISLLCPTPRGWIQFVRKDAHGNRDRDAFGFEIPFPKILPIETGAEIAVFVNQVIVMLSRMSSRVRPKVFPSKTRAISS